ncbi:MAG TPA: TetR/AcrR family transcriptional regulator C-terminal domain-containing protein [Vicinamibacterales bacterium]|jgi:AcrR family transcriptional regulator
MSIVPFRKTERQRRAPLDQARIVRAALALLDDVGFDDLTMRRLAERLDVKAASLYRHVRNKDELLVLLADEISGEIPLAPTSGTWQEQLTTVAHNVRRGLLAHRDAARVLASTAPFGPRRLHHIESLLRILRDAGLSGRDAARAAYHCNNFVTEFAADEARFSAMATGTSRKKLVADARRYFKSLPVDQFPTIVELADDLTDNDQEGLFQTGIDVWLRGIEALAKQAKRR